MVMLIALAPVMAWACGGDDDTTGGGASPTVAAGSAQPTRPGAPASGTASTGGSPVARATVVATRVVEHAAGAAWTEAEAAPLLDAVLLKPADLPGTWNVMSDTTSTNADAAQADPANAASNERCGRLLSRTLVSQAGDVVQAFIGGETLAYFSMGTVFATAEGATDCSNEQAARLGSSPGELARAFGQLWIDPDAVQVAVASFPPVGDASFSATLTGQISASGTTLDLTVLIVAFRAGNMTAVVGSARSGSTPAADELAPYVDLVEARIRANQ